MPENPLKVVGRVAIAMAVAGITLGLTAFFAWEWIDSIVIPSLEDRGDEIEIQIVEGIMPLVFLVVSALAAPVLAAVIGIFEGLRSTEVRNALIVGAGCLVGAAILVTFAGLFISQTGPPPAEDEESLVGALDLIALAGLSGIASFFAGLIATVFAAK